ncbi:hypothetical protein WJX73_003929 [Symbiochloris irregularis]|uniref:Beta-hydroxyacyl-ACP dehydratase n=1 Tax=Symbiochloris irregularis TaxID=706552 RepID=A0AAW1PZ85_9CHLO
MRHCAAHQQQGLLASTNRSIGGLHTLNCQQSLPTQRARAQKRSRRGLRSVTRAEAAPAADSALEKSGNAFKPLKDIEEIQKLLPHRFPFLLLDRVVEWEAQKYAIGYKNVTANDNFFTGHFPDRKIMPGVLQVEAMAQLGGIVMMESDNAAAQQNFFFGGIEACKFRRPVVPGDTLMMKLSRALDPVAGRHCARVMAEPLSDRGLLDPRIRLPLEQVILPHLPPEALGRLASTCKALNKLLYSELLNKAEWWRNLAATKLGQAFLEHLQSLKVSPDCTMAAGYHRAGLQVYELPGFAPRWKECYGMCLSESIFEWAQNSKTLFALVGRPHNMLACVGLWRHPSCI